MKWNRTNPKPTAEQLAAWADGELPRPAAERVEAWLAAHPDSTGEPEGSLVHLFRDCPPAEPSERAWQDTLARIEALTAPAFPQLPRRRTNLRLRLLLGLATTAAVLSGVTLAHVFWSAPRVGPQPRHVAEQTQPHDLAEGAEEPFPVAEMNEVNILSINVEDADRVVMGQPLLGPFEVVSPEDIEIVRMERHPEDGQMPRLRRGPEVPMIVVAAAEREEP